MSDESSHRAPAPTKHRSKRRRADYTTPLTKRSLKHRTIDANRKTREDAAIHRFTMLSGQNEESCERDCLLQLEVATARLQVLMTEAMWLSAEIPTFPENGVFCGEVHTHPINMPIDRRMHLRTIAECVRHQMDGSAASAERVFSAMCVPLLRARVTDANITDINELTRVALRWESVSEVVNHVWGPLFQALKIIYGHAQRVNTVEAPQPVERHVVSTASTSISRSSTPIVRCAVAPQQSEATCSAIAQLLSSGTEMIEVHWRLSEEETWSSFVWLVRHSTDPREIMVQLVRREQRQGTAV